MFRSLAVIPALLLVLGAHFAHAGPFTLEPNADAYTRESFPSFNFGASSTMKLQNDSSLQFGNQWGYIRYDFSSIPGTITHAVLNLYGHGSSGYTENTTVSLYPVADTTWGEMTINWNNQPSIGTSAIASVVVPGGDTFAWYAWDITAYVQAERAAGRNVISIGLKPSAAVGNILTTFLNKETTANRPYLSGTFSAPALHFVHVDHLNTPRAIYDANQQLRWQWDQLEPFGVNAPDENPSGLGIFEFPGRFLGQYHDKETNLAYNYFRDYDASVSRFTRSDPVGLFAGPNTYTYADNSPLQSADPRGLLLRPGVPIELLRPINPVPPPPPSPAIPATPYPASGLDPIDLPMPSPADVPTQPAANDPYCPPDDGCAERQRALISQKQQILFDEARAFTESPNFQARRAFDTRARIHNKRCPNNQVKTFISSTQ